MDLVQNKLRSDFLGIEWERFLPLMMGNVQLQASSYKQVLPYFQLNLERVFQQPSGSFLNEESPVAKQKYYSHLGDFFELVEKNSGKTVGVFAGNVTDWSTYYIRHCSVLPEFQGNGFYQQFLLFLSQVLKLHQMNRVEIDVSPSNFAHIHILNKFQFNITGLQMSERWGTIVRFTKFLNLQHEHFFLSRFCHGVKPQLSKEEL